MAMLLLSLRRVCAFLVMGVRGAIMRVRMMGWHQCKVMPAAVFRKHQLTKRARWRSRYECIDPNVGFSRSLVKSMRNKDLAQCRMNEVNTSVR
jgi:hypothetical protein